jgi:hypothetical protein
MARRHTRTDEERAELVEEALEHIDRAAELLRLAGPSEYFKRTALAALQGREHGWLGDSPRDQVAEWLEELEKGAEAEDEEAGDESA